MHFFSDKSKSGLLTVAVSGLNANDNPGPGLAVVRALREGLQGNVKIIGLAYETLEAAVYLPAQVDKTYRIPYPTAGTDALIDRLKYIDEIEGIDVIIPNFDAELFNFIKIEKELKALGIYSFLPSHQQLEQRDKVNLKRFGDTNGFNVPSDKIIYNEEDLYQTLEELGFPLVVKGRFYEAHIVQNYHDAKRVFHNIHASWGLPVIGQKFIKGTEINIAGLGDGKGNAISVVPMRKLYITDKGKAWAGVTIEDEKLVQLAKDFAKASSWKGGFELEIMKQENGDLFIMEINPRFPAWIYLTVAAGQNQPLALIKMALGKEIVPFEQYFAGKMFVRYAWDNIVDIEDFQKLSAFGEL